jgi:uncharacterized protein (TIGR02646 family)
MKFIRKWGAPKDFLDWRAGGNNNWQPKYKDLSGKIKKILKQNLMEEQRFLCCYCENELSLNDCHIEHFEPQSRPNVDPLDYLNLLCSCQNNPERGKPLHCGHLKSDWFDPNLLISPLDPTCENRFKFTFDGRIHPVNDNDQAAKMTISRLGLNIPKLRDLRRNAIEPFLSEEISSDELQRFVIGYLQPSQGRLGKFWTTIRFLFP